MTKNKKTCTQQAVCCNAGCMPAESPVGLSSVHTRANICKPRTTASRRTLYGILKQTTNRQIDGILSISISRTDK